MDNIITLIIIIIAVVSAISRIRTKQKPKSGAKPAASSELGTKLKAFFAEIQQKLEEQSPKSPSGAARWDALRNAGQAQDYELPIEDLDLEEEEPPAAPVTKPPVRPAGDRPKPVAAQAVDSAPEPCAPGLLAVKGAPCPEFLRKAVVWSEILGPPKALRSAPWER